jgi:hypothetical protein
MVVAPAVRAQTTPPQPALPQTPPAPPAAPVPEEAPPALPNPTPPKPDIAPTEVEKPAPVEKRKPVEDTPAEPMKRTRSPVAILQALDKVTAESLRFEAPVGQPIRYKNLVITVRACETSAPDELTPDFSAYLVVDSQPKAQPGRTPPPARSVFHGWMFASTPGVNALQHPVYDVWLIACKAADPSPAKP